MPLPLPVPVPPEPYGRSHTLELPATPEAVRAARGSAGEVLASWGVADELADSVVLVTSELVTNAVTHSGSERIVYRLYGTGGVVRVEVEDQNRGHRLPAPRRPGPEEQSGRGLLLVGTLSRDWGVAPAPDGGPGRVVWAELTAPKRP
ncbi:ATP-binding protein [Streptomyces sp. NPDC047000]|uniref:ATP-binding protein n=1 Tax=Streptomyces sp. NPDC047000 TaxID=3155474 RepID=UPI0033EB685D